jgi:hypothetical protein
MHEVLLLSREHDDHDDDDDDDAVGFIGRF